MLWAGRKVGRPWYEFHRLGWNYRMTEFQAAILRVQLSRLDEQVKLRDEMATLLSEKLAAVDGVSPLTRDPRCTRHGNHIYMFRYDHTSLGVPRDRFLEALIVEGIPAFSGYTFPLYKNPMFLDKKFINGSFPLGTLYHDDIDYAAFADKCPVSERACAGEAVWLPQNCFLGTADDIDDIVGAITKVIGILTK